MVKMLDKCKKCYAKTGKDCVVGQEPDECKYFEYQKDKDFAAEKSENSVIVEDNKKYYRRKDGNTIVSENNLKSVVRN